MKAGSFVLLLAGSALVAAQDARPAGPRRREGDLKVGMKAPNFTLTGLDGKPYELKANFGKRPTLLIFGSYT